MKYISPKPIIFLIVLFMGSIACGTVALAETVNFDLLLGIGDFDECYFNKIYGIDTRYGTVPTDNLKVSNGWSVEYILADQELYTFKLVTKSTFTGNGNAYMSDGKSYQYMGLNNTTADLKYAFLYSNVESYPNWLDETFTPGDKLVFHLDELIASNFISDNQYVKVGIMYKLAGDTSTWYYDVQTRRFI